MNDQQPLSLRGRSFGGLDDDHEVQLFTLARSGGVEVSILTNGGIIKSIRVPDRTGQLENVVLGFDELAAGPCTTRRRC
jgi:aldose 1-epimerase